MNSLIQEASSLTKAIELAWEKAGKPHKFSIRVFQESKKNFLGITKENAKIALLFDTRDLPSSVPSEKGTRAKEGRRQEHKRPKQPVHDRSKKQEVRPVKEQKQERHSKQKQQSLPRQEINKDKKPGKEQKDLWTDEMVAIARNWMKDALQKLNKSDATFTTEVKRYHMKFYFDKPIAETEEQQKNLFRNFAHVIMQTVRNRLKKQLRYHKVVISSEKK